mgnify:CR=1 FL=1
MEKLRSLRFLAVAAITCVIASQAMAVPSIWNTGVNDSGMALGSGDTDTHYTLVTPDGPATPIATAPNPWWVVPGSNSMWIGPTLSNVTDTVGTYTYSMSFSLTEEEIPLSLTGQWATDNTGVILLNGNSTGFSRSEPDTFYSLSDFQFDGSLLNVGVNTLTFVLENTPVVSGPNPTGLLVTNLALNYPASPIPAPGAVVLVSLGTCVIGFVRRRGIL